MYRRIPPCEALQPFVESFWIQEHVVPPLGTDRITRVLPAGLMGLLFHYQDPFLDVTAGRNERLPRATITGQRTRPIEVRAMGKTGILLVTFYPWGAAAFLPGSMMELVDRTTDLADVMRSFDVRLLEERISAAPSAAHRVRLVEDFLLEALVEDRRDPLAEVAAFRMRASDGLPRAAELAREHGLSRRQWMRRFQATVGLGPKSFTRIMRFQRATALKRSGRDWGEVCLACGYYDQSHLIKEFQEYAGCSFEAFAPGSTALMRTFNRPRPVSLFYNTIYL